ncbi:helix-turn-helix domain-containing protein [Nocardiopsis mangrovi]|uniref:Helix-turn-helix domain-containing protein n=1 Tax=Nocardiopsis mangrovi TaxID=1179818 RepID=A0ABV9E1H6_9ACTN
MSRKASPERKRFGRDLRAARERAGMSQAQVARALNVVQSAVSGWETGVRGMRLDHARLLDDQFGSAGAVVRSWSKANAARSLPEWYEEVEQLEGVITELREYQSQVIPGLIQTEGYIRAVLKDTGPWVTNSELDEMVRSRLRRQRILEKEAHPLVSMVVDETAVHRRFGGRAVLSEQLARVLDLVERGVIRFQVFPGGAECHPGASGPFRIYLFPDKPMVASAEHMEGEKLLDEMIHVQRCTTIFGILQSEALSTRTSAELVRKVKEELDDDA